MKLFLLTIMIMLGLVSCASHDEPYYDRANMANDKAQADLQQ